MNPPVEPARPSPPFERAQQVETRLPLWLAAVCAATGGLLLDAATPGLAWWWAAFPGIALVLAALWQQTIGRGALLGAIAGAAFWMPQISWLTLYLGPVPWAGLSGVMTAWWVLFGILAAIASRGLAQLSWLAARRWRLCLAQAAALAGLWVLREQVQGAWPYGGFPWGRIAHTQADGPLVQAVSWLGFAGLSGVVVFACAIPIAAWFARMPRLGLIAPGSTVVLLVLLAVIPAAPLPETGTLRVAAVQGNSKSGIFDDRESGSVLRDHLNATAALLDELDAAGEQVDVIVWPENSAEFNLPGNREADAQLRSLSKRAGAPIVVGSILPHDSGIYGGGAYTNSTLVWDEDGDTALRYDKRYPVPFAEYMPNREFFHALAPDLVDLVQLEYSAGKVSPVVEIAHGKTAQSKTSFAAGLAICFDVIFDGQATRMVDDGAEVIFAQTNNADFGRTDESAQQLAIARLRAVETGRALVNISTVGTSAVVAPDGRDLDRLVPFTADAMVAEVPLVQGETPALRYGAAITWLWGVLGGAGAVAGGVVLLRSRRARR
ncbi:apolipoprotein N-acyltransferase [Leucobacter insecticola]|uniref:Apolipoprotein N-acyltransferase n=1 Tax=Leucobacter insecticola TaxID=2714934 RepID=A0A6G8FJ25_9MICO|nr:apolipoprotein N-acyltransferase [Leucobacter insecticola]QIM16466.1 apolipoprotein N-acyltransferase [Leucobacter insecticola]